jgi:hypothetical protein
MKKLLIILILGVVFTSFNFSPTPVLAQTASSFDSVFGKVNLPDPLKALNKGTASASVSSFLSQIVALIYAVATVVFFFMIIFGAFQWMTSGGDKEAAGKARSRITYAVIGFVLLALAFVIASVVSSITGFKIGI